MSSLLSKTPSNYLEEEEKPFTSRSSIEVGTSSVTFNDLISMPYASEQPPQLPFKKHRPHQLHYYQKELKTLKTTKGKRAQSKS